MNTLAPLCAADLRLYGLRVVRRIRPDEHEVDTLVDLQELVEDGHDRRLRFPWFEGPYHQDDFVLLPEPSRSPEPSTLDGSAVPVDLVDIDPIVDHVTRLRAAQVTEQLCRPGGLEDQALRQSERCLDSLSHPGIHALKPPGHGAVHPEVDALVDGPEAGHPRSFRCFDRGEDG